MRVETRDADGNPICYVCERPVARAGEACSAECYLHFATVVSNQDSLVDMENYIDHTDHEWFQRGTETEGD